MIKFSVYSADGGENAFNPRSARFFRTICERN